MLKQTHEKYLQFLDGLRGLAALYVMVGHARWLLWEGYREGFRLPFWLDILWDRQHVCSLPTRFIFGGASVFETHCTSFKSLVSCSLIDFAVSKKRHRNCLPRDGK